MKFEHAEIKLLLDGQEFKGVREIKYNTDVIFTPKGRHYFCGTPPRQFNTSIEGTWKRIGKYWIRRALWRRRMLNRQKQLGYRPPPWRGGDK